MEYAEGFPFLFEGGGVLFLIFISLSWCEFPHLGQKEEHWCFYFFGKRLVDRVGFTGS